MAGFPFHVRASRQQEANQVRPVALHLIDSFGAFHWHFAGTSTSFQSEKGLERLRHGVLSKQVTASCKGDMPRSLVQRSFLKKEAFKAPKELQR